jgi:hypothetical protein
MGLHCISPRQPGPVERTSSSPTLFPRSRGGFLFAAETYRRQFTKHPLGPNQIPCFSRNHVDERRWRPRRPPARSRTSANPSWRFHSPRSSHTTPTPLPPTPRPLPRRSSSCRSLAPVPRAVLLVPLLRADSPAPAPPRAPRGARLPPLPVRPRCARRQPPRREVPRQPPAAPQARSRPRAPPPRPEPRPRLPAPVIAEFGLNGVGRLLVSAWAWEG